MPQIQVIQHTPDPNIAALGDIGQGIVDTIQKKQAMKLTAMQYKINAQNAETEIKKHEAEQKAKFLETMMKLDIVGDKDEGSKAAKMGILGNLYPDVMQKMNETGTDVLETMKRIKPPPGISEGELRESQSKNYQAQAGEAASNAALTNAMLKMLPGGQSPDTAQPAAPASGEVPPAAQPTQAPTQPRPNLLRALLGGVGGMGGPIGGMVNVMGMLADRGGQGGMVAPAQAPATAPAPTQPQPTPETNPRATALGGAGSMTPTGMTWKGLQLTNLPLALQQKEAEAAAAERGRRSVPKELSDKQVEDLGTAITKTADNAGILFSNRATLDKFMGPINLNRPLAKFSNSSEAATFRAFGAQVGQAFRAFTHIVSGAQIGMKELNSLEEMVPSVKDTPNAFMAKTYLGAKAGETALQSELLVAKAANRDTSALEAALAQAVRLRHIAEQMLDPGTRKNLTGVSSDQDFKAVAQLLKRGKSVSEAAQILEAYRAKRGK